jgi:CDP-4-dehydro-6-deoxyglucose reductase, E1
MHLNNSYPLTFDSWDKEEISSINKVIKSNQFTYSENVRLFEKELAIYHGVKYCVLTNSGSSANLIAISSLFYKKKKPLKINDEVIVPGVSWSTTYSPLQQLGLKLRVVDIDIDTLNIDKNLVEKAITKNTKLIIPVNILGNPSSLNELEKLCQKHQIYLMEDNCESFGAMIKKRKTGTFGIVNTLSFFYSHHISTIEGGAVLTNNYEIYNILLSLRSHGWERDSIKIKNKKKEIYRFLYPGFNVRPTEFTGAIGRVQISKVDKFIKKRRDNHKIYQNLFYNHKLFKIQKENEKSSSFSFIFILRKNFKHIKRRLFKHLKRNNIQYRLITGGSFIRHPSRKYFNYKVYKSLKNSNYVHDNGFFIGNSPNDLKNELIYFKKKINEFIIINNL